MCVYYIAHVLMMHVSQDRGFSVSVQAKKKITLDHSQGIKK